MMKSIPVEKLKAGSNIRSEVDEEFGELLQSLERYGQLQPVLVVARGDRYEVVAGLRRYRAMCSRNEPYIDCVVLTDIPEADLPFIQLIENVQRLNLRPWEYVKCFDAMKSHDPRLTNAAIAARIGKSSAWVAQQYAAAKSYGELVAEGIPEKTLEAIPNSTLTRLKSVVTDPEKRKAAAMEVASGCDLEEALDKRFPLANLRPRSDHSVEGVNVKEYGSNDILLLCKDARRKAEVQEVVIDTLMTVDALRISWSRSFRNLQPSPATEETEILAADLFTQDIRRRLGELGYDIKTLRFTIGKRGGLD